MFDNIRIRTFAFPEPATTLGNKQSNVTIGGRACEDVNVINSTTITCKVPSGVLGKADIIVTNPDSESAVLENAFEYLP